ncbi:MAG TPA: nuclear transport factor 2 family protein [Thermoplasmata archaeon]|nr:nuclear transport factor 2 family protein [Thermoplasmata archaeon]
MRYGVLERAKKALQGGDADVLVDCYADPCLLEDVPSGETWTTHEALTSMYRRLLAPPTRFSEVRVLEGDGWAAIAWTWSGVNRGTNAPFRIRGVSVVEIRDGRIGRETLYYDPRPSLP